MKNHIDTYFKSLNKTVDELKKLPVYRIDNEVALLKDAFDIAYNNDIFNLYKFDTKTQDSLKLKLFSKLSPYSGSLSFLAIQILAANAIMGKNNFKKKDYYFKKRCGIAINHLRGNKTVVKAEKCENGYRLTGTLTWASGYKIFDELLIGFHYDNKEYEVLANFKEAAGFSIMDTPQTFVGQSLNTVNVRLDDFFVTSDDIVSSNIIGNYSKNKSISKTVHYALYSIGKAAIKNIEDELFKKVAKKRLKKIKQDFIASKDGQVLDELRIRLFNLIQKIITTAIVLNGGKSILTTKNLQRYYRELIMFNANGLNQDIKNLFLEDFIYYSK
jgi:hypothetical protein